MKFNYHYPTSSTKSSYSRSNFICAHFLHPVSQYDFILIIERSKQVGIKKVCCCLQINSRFIVGWLHIVCVKAFGSFIFISIQSRNQLRIKLFNFALSVPNSHNACAWVSTQIRIKRQNDARQQTKKGLPLVCAKVISKAHRQKSFRLQIYKRFVRARSKDA